MGNNRYLSKPAQKKVWSSDAAFAKIVRLCNVRERSILELEQRLQRDGVPQKLAAPAIKRAAGCGLVDESRFAESFVRGKTALGWGQMRIERELERFGVDPNLLEGYPEGYFSEAGERARALAELGRFRTSAHNVQDARYRRLCSKGYSFDAIKYALAVFEEDSSLSKPEESASPTQSAACQTFEDEGFGLSGYED